MTNSSSKLHKHKPLNLVQDNKKYKKGKQTVSVINLAKEMDESSKLKGSSTITKRKGSAA